MSRGRDQARRKPISSEQVLEGVLEAALPDEPAPGERTDRAANRSADDGPAPAEILPAVTKTTTADAVSARPAVGPLLVAVIGVGALWVVLGALAFRQRSVGPVLLAAGAAAAIFGRYRLARALGGKDRRARLLYLLVPFAPVLAVLRRLDHAIAPFLLSCGGVVFLATGTAAVIANSEESWGTATASPSAAAVAADDDGDSECEALLAAPNKAEALAWLENADQERGVGNWERERAVALVRNVYGHGAEMVYAVDIRLLGKAERAVKLVATLPRDPARRRDLLSWHAETFARDADTDHGQKYLLIKVD